MSVIVGAEVRVRPGATPWYGWNGVTANSVGLVTSIQHDGDCCVCFPECPEWLGRVVQLERAAAVEPRPAGHEIRRDVQISEDVTFPADGWVANLVRPTGCDAERTLCDGVARMFTATQPQHLHQGRDVREDCPPYNGICVAGVWQVASECRNNLYHMQREALKRRLRRSLPAGLDSLHREETHISQFHSLMPVDLDTDVNEVLLLHGTKPEHVRDILAHGLNERLCSGIFGHGTYLAEDVEKIDQYTEVDEELHTRGELRELHARLFGEEFNHPGSIYYAFVCRVTLGQAIRTKDGRFSVDNGDLWASGPDADIHELACIPGSSPSERHHSLVAETGNRIARFREFVVYHAGAQVLPEFLVAYHRTQDGVPIGRGYEMCQQMRVIKEPPPRTSPKAPRRTALTQHSSMAPQSSAAHRHRHTTARTKSRARVKAQAQALVAKIRLPEQKSPTAWGTGKEESVDELIRSSRDAAMVLAAGGPRRGDLAQAACSAMSPERKAAVGTKARRNSRRAEARRKSQGPQPPLRPRSLARQRNGGSSTRRRPAEMPRLFGPDSAAEDPDEEFSRLCAEALAAGRCGAGSCSPGGGLAARAAAGEVSPKLELQRQPSDTNDIDNLLEELSGMLSPVGGVSSKRRTPH